MHHALPELGPDVVVLPECCPDGSVRVEPLLLQQLARARIVGHRGRHGLRMPQLLRPVRQHADQVQRALRERRRLQVEGRLAHARGEPHLPAPGAKIRVPVGDRVLVDHPGWLLKVVRRVHQRRHPPVDRAVHRLEPLKVGRPFLAPRVQWPVEQVAGDERLVERAGPDIGVLAVAQGLVLRDDQHPPVPLAFGRRTPVFPDPHHAVDHDVARRLVPHEQPVRITDPRRCIGRGVAQGIEQVVRGTASRVGFHLDLVLVANLVDVLEILAHDERRPLLVARAVGEENRGRIGDVAREIAHPLAAHRVGLPYLTGPWIHGQRDLPTAVLRLVVGSRWQGLGAAVRHGERCRGLGQLARAPLRVDPQPQDPATRRQLPALQVPVPPGHAHLVPLVPEHRVENLRGRLVPGVARRRNRAEDRHVRGQLAHHRREPDLSDPVEDRLLPPGLVPAHPVLADVLEAAQLGDILVVLAPGQHPDVLLDFAQPRPADLLPCAP